MSTTFFDALAAAERIARTNLPVSDRLEEIGQYLTDVDVRREFFRRLDDPAWIVPLRSRGYFAAPPSIQRSEGGGSIYPHWQESKYLARMAQFAAEDVASVFSTLRTDNPSVVGDMVRAALAMPTTIATTLAPSVSVAANSGSLRTHFKDASKLCTQLAAGGEPDAALTLADALFTPDHASNVASTREDYWHKNGLAIVVPALASTVPHAFLPKVCNWLRAMIVTHKRPNSATGYDSSYVWRPAIEEHKENSDHDIVAAMVGLVRAGFETAIRNGMTSLDESLEVLARYSFLVFKRMTLHLINEFADSDPDLARQNLMNHDFFEGVEFKHEYAMLVGRRFELLSQAEQAKWLAWVDTGPDMTDFNESIQRNLGRDATEEDRTSRIEYWQFHRLHWARRHLRGKYREFYDRMYALHGEPEMVDMSVSFKSRWRGDDSPMSVGQLSAMTFEEAIQTIVAWKPTGSRFTGPSVDGLASTFRQYLATNPSTFSSQASLLIGKPATYVRRFIDQMKESVKAGATVDVSAVLALCAWVVEQPLREGTMPTEDDDPVVDKDWEWTRNEISSFIEEVCEAKAGENPRYPMEGFREPMGRLLSVLCKDRADSDVVHDITADNPRLHDYLDLAINSPRGRALQATLEYARWIGNHVKETTGKEEVIRQGFGVMPEVREMLNWQLAAQNRSHVAMAILGSRLGLIYWIDKQWLADHSEQLFNLSVIERDPSASQSWAAWNAFLVWGQPHIEFYRLFKPQFAYAVQQSTSIQLTEQTREQPMYRLGEHLMALYGRGQLGLDDDDKLLRRFIETAHPDIRRHSMGFVGQSLRNNEKTPAEAIERFQCLWETYWSRTGKEDAKQKPGHWFFGMWFSSGQFPEKWALDQLEQFVEIDPAPEPDFEVAKELARIAATDIEVSVSILDRMVRGDREGWRIDGWIEPAKQVLDMAVRAGGSAGRIAVALIDYLGRRGYTDFGQLLPRQPSQ